MSYFFEVGSQTWQKFQGCNLKIQHRTSFDLNGLKNGLTKNWYKSAKYWWEVWILGRGFKESKREEWALRATLGTYLFIKVHFCKLTVCVAIYVPHILWKRLTIDPRFPCLKPSSSCHSMLRMRSCRRHPWNVMF